MTAAAAPGAGLDRFAVWVTANGGEVLSIEPAAVRYRSIAGEGSVVATKAGYAYTGDGRLALTCCQIGTTLSPFAIGPEPALIHRADAGVPACPSRRATVFSDASWCPESKAAGWAAWMIADGRTSRTASAEIPIACASSDEAEVIAALEAVRCGLADGYVADGAEVLLQSDSLYALAAIRKAMPATVDRQHASQGRAVQPHRKAVWTATVERSLNELRALVKRHRLVIHVRHVPGHTAGDGRQWVNRECDRLAKTAMRSRRASAALRTGEAGA